MRETKCDAIRRELDELMLGDEFRPAAAAHLQECSDCAEFQRRQTKLRQMVGSLGTVSAPPDFDFRLRARLQADSQAARIPNWFFASRGLATAAVLVLFAVGTLVLWQRANQRTSEEESFAANEPKVTQEQRELPRPEDTKVVNMATHGSIETPRGIENVPQARKTDRSSQSSLKVRRPLVAVDFSKEGASIISGATAGEVFPIETSLQPFKVSLDDGRGNARTISVPTISFGSQKVLAKGNQFAPKGVW